MPFWKSEIYSVFLEGYKRSFYLLAQDIPWLLSSFKAARPEGFFSIFDALKNRLEGSTVGRRRRYFFKMGLTKAG